MNDRLMVAFFAYVRMNVSLFLGFPEIVFLLLNAGLDPKQKDSFGQVGIVTS